ncbi:MAG: ACT domain-containing protein [Melioribacteraceae bacterium]|nr:ACT domain-containing protein [Melioribacteraceae bacterium]
MRITEEEIRKITLNAIAELGDRANPGIVKEVVSKTVANLESSTSIPDVISDSGKVILTSFGLNHPGIVAGITSALSETKCDIKDISQKIMSEFYTMIMILDITSSPKSLKEIQEKLNNVAAELHVKVYLQHEDLFRSMHRI